MQYPEAYEASLTFPESDTLKTNDNDISIVVIYRGGSRPELANEVEAEAKSQSGFTILH